MEPPPSRVGCGWSLTHGAVLALVASGAHAAVIADVVLAYPVVEAGLGDAWGTTYGSRRASESAPWTPRVRTILSLLH